MTIPYTFAGATTAIPLAQLDANFASPITLGNVAMTLSNTYTSIGNLTLTNVTISSGTINSAITQTYGNANAVVFTNSSNVATTSTSLYFDGTNLGIDTASPQNKLHIFNSSTSYVRFQSTNRTFTIGALSSDYSFVINDVDASAERMRIDASGTPMFNCTTQLIRGGETFRANMGSGLASFYANTVGPTIAIKNATGVSTYQVAFNNSVGEVGTITTGSGSTAYNTSSDYRLKENISPMTGALAKVQALKPVTYTWKSDGVNGEGFIAHELAEVCPQAVTGKKDGTRTEKYEISPAISAELDEDGKVIKEVVEAVMGEREMPEYQGIDTSFLVATLTAAIQEQQALITTLQTQVAALQAKVGA